MPSMGRCRCDSWRQVDATTWKRSCRTSARQQVILRASTDGQARLVFPESGFVVYPQRQIERERWQEARLTPDVRLAEAQVLVEDELVRRFCQPPHRGWGRMRRRVR